MQFCSQPFWDKEPDVCSALQQGQQVFIPIGQALALVAVPVEGRVFVQTPFDNPIEDCIRSTTKAIKTRTSDCMTISSLYVSVPGFVPTHLW
ncbi:MAG: hypothetical protein P4L46_15525 [Fimbriimonas sp.]|nr:hypothetical protein [Fimbriimonas sp.]